MSLYSHNVLIVTLGCLGCPANAVADLSSSSCVCKEGYYSIPFSDANLLLFNDLDSENYNIYRSTYITNNDAIWDPNEYLGFWCSICPLGANCSVKGTSLDSVQPQEGYYIGLDFTGTQFFECFNPEACVGTGICQPGYTGIVLSIVLLFDLNNLDIHWFHFRYSLCSM